MNAQEIIYQLPLELAARLLADEYFCDIPVAIAEKGNIKRQIDSLTAAVTDKGGKRGVAVIVLQLIAEDEEPNLVFGPLKLRPAFQIVENVTLNRDDLGTKKPALSVARRLVDVIKSTLIEGVATALVADTNCIRAVTDEHDMAKNLIVYEVGFSCMEDSHVTPLQTIAPQWNVAENFLTLTCAEPAAVIWFTLDGSYPSPQGKSAQVFAGPIPVPAAGLCVRACAYAPGEIASFVIQQQILVN